MLLRHWPRRHGYGFLQVVKPLKLALPNLVSALSVFICMAVTTMEARADIEVKDLKGRSISLSSPAHRLVIDDGRIILALSFLSDDPVKLVAAWPHDIDRFGRELYDSYKEKFPMIENLPRSTSNAQDLAVENIIATNPDAVILSVYSHPGELQLAQLAEAGIPVIFVDFITDPLNNTDRSLDVLGKVIGRQQRADRILSLRKSIKDQIAGTLHSAMAQPMPTIFLEAHASTQENCCNSPGNSGIGKFLAFVKAHNLGEVLGSKPFGQVNLEYVVASKPDVYIATGGEYMQKRGGLRIGPHYSKEETLASLQELLDRPGFSSLASSATAHGLSQQLFNSPLDILVLELLAKWAHQDLFRDLDIEASRLELNALMAVPLADGYWTR